LAIADSSAVRGFPASIAEAARSTRSAAASIENGHVGDHRLHAAEIGEARAELPPPLHVRDRLPEGAPRHAQGCRADRRAVKIEDLHRDREPLLSLVAEAAARRERHPLKAESADRCGRAPEALRDAQAAIVPVHDEALSPRGIVPVRAKRV